MVYDYFTPCLEDHNFKHAIIHILIMDFRILKRGLTILGLKVWDKCKHNLHTLEKYQINEEGMVKGFQPKENSMF